VLESNRRNIAFFPMSLTMMMVRVISNKTFFEYKGGDWLMACLYHVELGYSLRVFFRLHWKKQCYQCTIVVQAALNSRAACWFLFQFNLKNSKKYIAPFV